MAGASTDEIGADEQQELLLDPERSAHRWVDGAVTASRLLLVALRSSDLDLVRRGVAVRSLSRAAFGWATDDPLRVWAYPWSLRQVEVHLDGRTRSAIDIGAGPSPVPIALQLLGLRTIVVHAGADHGASTGRRNLGRRSLSRRSLGRPTEGYAPDYATFGMETTDSKMDALTVPTGSLGFALSESVIGHVPGETRRAGLAEISRVLEPGGLSVLTVDLEPGSIRLWHRATAIGPQPDAEHGSVIDLVNEAAVAGLVLEAMERCPLRSPKEAMGLVLRKGSGAAGSEGAGAPAPISRPARAGAGPCGTSA